MKSLSTAERSKICEILSENDGEFLMSIDDFIEVRKEVEIFFLFYVSSLKFFSFHRTLKVLKFAI